MQDMLVRFSYEDGKKDGREKSVTVKEYGLAKSFSNLNIDNRIVRAYWIGLARGYREVNDNA